MMVHALAPGTAALIVVLAAAWLVTPWLLIAAALLVLLQGLDMAGAKLR
jgi:hypothetical protein